MTTRSSDESTALASLAADFDDQAKRQLTQLAKAQGLDFDSLWLATDLSAVFGGPGLAERRYYLRKAGGQAMWHLVIVRYNRELDPQTTTGLVIAADTAAGAEDQYQRHLQATRLQTLTDELRKQKTTIRRFRNTVRKLRGDLLLTNALLRPVAARDEVVSRPKPTQPSCGEVFLELLLKDATSSPGKRKATPVPVDNTRTRPKAKATRRRK